MRARAVSLRACATALRWPTMPLLAMHAGSHALGRRFGADRAVLKSRLQVGCSRTGAVDPITACHGSHQWVVGGRPPAVLCVLRHVSILASAAMCMQAEVVRHGRAHLLVGVMFRHAKRLHGHGRADRWVGVMCRHAKRMHVDRPTGQAAPVARVEHAGVPRRGPKGRARWSSHDGLPHSRTWPWLLGTGKS
jgi:hypothetical protein